MTAVIRPAVAGDLPALFGLYAEIHPDDPRLPAADAERLWSEIAAQAGHAVLLAMLDETAVGTATCVVVPNLTRGGRPYMLIENVVVSAAVRRRGVGRRLLDAALGLAVAAGCYKVQLLSNATRVEAHAFYEACGFRPLAQGYRMYLD